MKRIAACLFGAVAMLGTMHASGADYPTKSIRLIVPFAPGGGTDLLARLVAPPLGETLGQQIVVDNRGGGGSVIGTQIVAKAAADGYTLGFLDTAFVINPAIATSLPYNTEKDFVILNIVGTSPTVLVVHSGVPAKSLNELIAYAKQNPGSFRFLAAPAAVSRLVQQRLIAAMEKLAHMPDLAKRMAENGYDPTFIGPPGSRQYVLTEMEKWRKVMKESALKVN